jgi:hypothetical protein
MAWRRLARDRTIGWIVAAGLVTRGLGGALLFWTSFLGWPFASSLQLGAGVWFFALDGLEYSRLAAAAASQGLAGIASLSADLPSPFYIRALALFMWLFGTAASTALALNLVAHLALCAVIVSAAHVLQTPRWQLLAALTVANVMPSWILWSLQPLKDPVFFALVAGFGLATMRLLGQIRGRWSERLPFMAGQAAALYAMAGIRWYYAVLALIATAAAALVQALRRPFSLPTFAATGLWLLLLAQVIPIAAGPYLPPWVRGALRPAPATVATIAAAPQEAVAQVAEARAGAERVGGATAIEVPGPPSVARRLVAGIAAMWLPRFVGNELGVVQLTGGRGFWLIADLDTLLFTVVMAGSLVLTGAALRRGARFTGATLPLLSVTVVLAGLLVYQSANFGTLFRLRAMVAVGFLLLPFTVRHPSEPARVPPARSAGHR